MLNSSTNGSEVWTLLVKAKGSDVVSVQGLGKSALEGPGRQNLLGVGCNFFLVVMDTGTGFSVDGFQMATLSLNNCENY